MAIDILKDLAQQAPDAAAAEAANAKSIRMALLAKQLGNPQVVNRAQAQDVLVQSQAAEGQQRVEQLQKQQQLASATGALVAQREGLSADMLAKQQSLSQEERIQNKRAQMAQRLQNESLADRKKELASDIATAKRVQQAGAEYDTKLMFATTKQRQDLARLGNGIKEELFDERLVFEKDQRDRKFASARQLADYAALSAKNDADLQNKLIRIDAANNNARILTESIRNRLAAMEERGYLSRKGDLDRAMNEKLAALRAEAERAAQRAAARARNKAAMTSAISTVVSMGVGIGVTVATQGNVYAGMAAGTAAGVATNKMMGGDGVSGVGPSVGGASSGSSAAAQQEKGK